MEISHEDHTIMEGVEKVYNLKKDKDTKKTYCEPRMHPSTNVCKFDLPDGSGTEWFMSVDDYVKAAVNLVSTNLSESWMDIYGKADSVIRTIYCPDLDVSPFFNGGQENNYQNRIEVLRWVVDLEHIVIHIEVALLSQNFSSTPKGRS